MPGYIVGNEEYLPVNDKKTQVYYATHEMRDGAWERSSFMYRSFISFTYGGKPIEDFNLIATIQNDRIQRNVYASFEDSTTNYETIDGQFYWGTHFLNNGITFSLATDGITEDELNEFRRWFRPGQNKELVLAENPNRGILARVAAPPIYSLLPFEEKTQIKLDSISYKTSTILYKGEISLSFIMDEPFWYSRSSLIKYYYTDKEDKFGTMRNTFTSDIFNTIEDKDILKVIIEDRIPYVESLQTEAILANNTYALLHGDGNNIFSQIVGGVEIEQNGNYYAHIDNELNNPHISGMIGVVLNEDNDNQSLINLTLSNETTHYLYYSGTAPEKPIISFELKPQISNGVIPYIAYPNNTYSKDNENKAYNTLTIGDAEMRFTLPSVWLGYNQALAIAHKFVETQSAVEELRMALITGVNEYYSRAWAIHCLDTFVNTTFDASILNATLPFVLGATTSINVANTGILPDIFISIFDNMMRDFIDTNAAAKFIFNSKTGSVQAEIPIKKVDSTTEIISKMAGDMLRSDYIQIIERNKPNENGYITDAQCTPITTNYPATAGGLTNFSVIFKNMYY